VEKKRLWRWTSEFAVGAGHIRGLGFAIACPKSCETRNKKRGTIAVLIGRTETEIHDTGCSDTLGGTTRKGRMGVLIVDAKSGQILFETKRGSLFCPGIEHEMLTTALALATLGPDYRFSNDIGGADRRFSGRQNQRAFAFCWARAIRTFPTENFHLIRKRNLTGRRKKRSSS